MFELEISGNEFVVGGVDNEIEKLETLDDVKNYYLYERSWVNDEGLVDLLIDFIINVKME